MSAYDLHHGERERLLRHLALAEAFATPSALGCGRLALFRRVGVTTLGAGYVEMAVADALVQAGLAAWQESGKTRQLTACRRAAPQSAPAQAAISDGGTEQATAVNDRESPLLWLHRRVGKDGKPQISAMQFAAGERFRADLTLAQMLPRTTMNWDASLAPGARDIGARDRAGSSDAAIAARQRVRGACDRLGPELSGLAIDICGFLKGLDQVERERAWPARSAKIVLRLALSGLSAHYGLDREAVSSRRHEPWLAQDARPAIMPAASRGVGQPSSAARA